LIAVEGFLLECLLAPSPERFGAQEASF